MRSSPPLKVFKGDALFNSQNEMIFKWKWRCFVSYFC